MSYNIVKYCNVCRKRFIVKQGESKIRYCEKCQKKMDEHYKKEAKEEAKAEAEAESKAKAKSE